MSQNEDTTSATNDTDETEDNFDKTKAVFPLGAFIAIAIAIAVATGILG